MNITVLVPTYRRPKDLVRCLEALKKQRRSPDEVLVIVRDIDSETWSFLENCHLDPLPLSTVKVTVTGQVAALNAGLDEAKGEIIAITDDDAAPHVDWLERIEAHYLVDKTIGGVGGRDFLYIDNKLIEGTKKTVGKLQWFGGTIGNHHLGVGEPREVDILKGANMSFRKDTIAGLRFDERLRGTGAQVHNDLSFCLAVRRRGWKLIYDPSVAIDHYFAQRFDEDQRGKFSEIATINRVHNQTLVLLEHLSPLRRTLFLSWAILVGTRANRGFLQYLRFLPSESFLAGQKLLASFQGLWQGWQTWRQTKVENIKI
ncbi:MAG: glycosyltransferase [Xenococcaceae cyanobacterium MO_167.B27]|nr:glycosyltransferase [Xenococcaceae cyanobacterium MO_167.B27]